VPLRMGDQTAGMSEMDRRLGDRGPLAAFIAERRVPGRDWRSYEQIAGEIKQVTGIPVTGVGVQKWAERLGIPMTSARATDAEVRRYRRRVAKFLRAPRGERTA
jgi:hypothetical protein